MAIVFTLPERNGFHFLDVVKNEVYEKNPKTVNELKDYIREEYREIDEDRNSCYSACESVQERLRACCNVEGRYLST